MLSDQEFARLCAYIEGNLEEKLSCADLSRAVNLPQDREIISFDGRTMVLRWMDPEVAGRYGTGVYVRCAPEGVARATKPKPAAQ